MVHERLTAGKDRKTPEDDGEVSGYELPDIAQYREYVRQWAINTMGSIWHNREMIIRCRMKDPDEQVFTNEHIDRKLQRCAALTGHHREELIALFGDPHEDIFSIALFIHTQHIAERLLMYMHETPDDAFHPDTLKNMYDQLMVR